MIDIFLPNVDADIVKKAIDAQENFLLLDVRTKQEYEKEHIRESVNIPFDELRERIGELPEDKHRKIYVYCFSGSRSAPAAEQLLKFGYDKVFDMNHGILAWRAKKYPLQER